MECGLDGLPVFFWTPHALRDDAWLKRNPEARADDLHWALTNGEVKGVISTIGGDDSVRILPYLDPEIIRANPKILMGFSDSTISLAAFLNAGVVAFHGPALLTDLAENGGIVPVVERSIRKTLFDAEPAPWDVATDWTEEVLADFGRNDMPVISGLDAGHTSPQLVVPLGCRVRVNPEARIIESLEAAVRTDVF